MMLRWLAVLACLMAVPAWAEHVTLPGPLGITLQAELFRPASGSGAAIVALHGCGGAYPSRDRQWRDRLLADGHILLFPDSFGSRGLKSQCRETHRGVTPDGLRRADAIAAAQWLSAQPGVPRGIVVLGWSDGGSTTVAVAQQTPDLPPGLFRGFVAFYPGCRVMELKGYQPAAPLLMLHGEIDDWTPFKRCQEAMAAVGSPLITQHGYPGAYHDFDTLTPVHEMDNIPSSQNWDKTIHAGMNPAAREDALARVPAFIDSLPAP
jgi:dienelactone hydrolase